MSDMKRKSPRGIEYDLIAALNRNPVIIQAGADICAESANTIEALQARVVELEIALYNGIKCKPDEAYNKALENAARIADAFADAEESSRRYSASKSIAAAIRAMKRD